jgi:hypothetical protein
MANSKIRKKNTKYQSNQEYDELVRGGKDVFYSAVIVAGSAIAAGVIVLIMYLQKLIFN